MRYTIGASMWKKRKPDTVVEGIYGFGHYAIPYIHIPDKDAKLKDSVFPVFSNAADAEHFARVLSRAYRCDDTYVHGRQSRSSYIRRFYPLKIDTKEFPYQIKIDGNDAYIHRYLSNLPQEDQETKIPVTCFGMYRK